MQTKGKGRYKNSHKRNSHRVNNDAIYGQRNNHEQHTAPSHSPHATYPYSQTAYREHSAPYSNWYAYGQPTHTNNRGSRRKKQHNNYEGHSNGGAHDYGTYNNFANNKQPTHDYGLSIGLNSDGLVQHEHNHIYNGNYGSGIHANGFFASGHIEVPHSTEHQHSDHMASMQGQSSLNGHFHQNNGHTLDGNFGHYANGYKEHGAYGHPNNFIPPNDTAGHDYNYVQTLPETRYEYNNEANEQARYGHEYAGVAGAPAEPSTISNYILPEPVEPEGTYGYSATYGESGSSHQTSFTSVISNEIGQYGHPDECTDQEFRYHCLVKVIYYEFLMFCIHKHIFKMFLRALFTLKWYFLYERRQLFIFRCPYLEKTICVHYEKLCDGVDDCGDGSDEVCVFL